MHKKRQTFQSVVNRHERLGVILLLSVIILSFLFQAVQRNQSFIPFDPQFWEDRYNQSQWMVPESKHPISDEGLYIHVGQLLTEGHDPSLINAEVPPFGKYVIGFFNRTTGYLGIYGTVFSALSLFLFFILNKLLFKSTFFALLPVALFSLDPIFTDQIAVGLLDSLYLCFLLLTFILFLQKRYMLTAIAAGLFMATKSPFLIVVVYISLFSFLFLQKKAKWRDLLLMPIVTLLVYVLTHAQLFFLGHDLRYFLSVQNFMLHFYQTGAKGIFAAVVPLLLSGYWFTWFGENRFIKEWSLLWPVISLITLVATFRLLKNKLFSSPFFFLLLWSIFYFGFLCLTPVFPRYLLLLLPFLYNLSIWVLLPSTDSK